MLLVLSVVSIIILLIKCHNSAGNTYSNSQPIPKCNCVSNDSGTTQKAIPELSCTENPNSCDMFSTCMNVGKDGYTCDQKCGTPCPN